jgi:hypothetical protein
LDDKAEGDYCRRDTGTNRVRCHHIETKLSPSEDKNRPDFRFPRGKVQRTGHCYSGYAMWRAACQFGDG